MIYWLLKWGTVPSIEIIENKRETKEMQQRIIKGL
jgi:hypothetical protein